MKITNKNGAHSPPPVNRKYARKKHNKYLNDRACWRVISKKSRRVGKEDPERRVEAGRGSSEFQRIPQGSLEGRTFRQGNGLCRGQGEA